MCAASLQASQENELADSRLLDWLDMGFSQREVGTLSCRHLCHAPRTTAAMHYVWVCLAQLELRQANTILSVLVGFAGPAAAGSAGEAAESDARRHCPC